MKPPRTKITRTGKQVVGKLNDDMTEKAKEMDRLHTELVSHMKKADVMAMKLKIKQIEFWAEVRETMNLTEEPRITLDEDTYEIVAVPPGYCQRCTPSDAEEM